MESLEDTINADYSAINSSAAVLLHSTILRKASGGAHTFEIAFETSPNVNVNMYRNKLAPCAALSGSVKFFIISAYMEDRVYSPLY
jgi:hypothetical protein